VGDISFIPLRGIRFLQHCWCSSLRAILVLKTRSKKQLHIILLLCLIRHVFSLPVSLYIPAMIIIIIIIYSHSYRKTAFLHSNTVVRVRYNIIPMYFMSRSTVCQFVRLAISERCRRGHEYNSVIAYLYIRS